MVRLATCELVTSPARSALAVCTVAPSAVTVTLSLGLPTSRRTSPTLKVSEAERFRFRRSLVLKPSFLTVSRYSPGARLGSAKLPASLDTV